MASTFSDLKIELIGTGEQAGTWGTTTNINLGTALEEAIVGSANVSFSSADVTLTLTNTNGTQAARHLRLNLTGTSGGARQLILGSGCQIDKPYLINNGLADTVTVKNTTGTGVAVPAGKAAFVYNDGTDVKTAFDYVPTLTTPSATISSATISSATISGGTINSTTVGATTPAAGSFTTLSSTGNTTLVPDVVISGSSANAALRITQTGAGDCLLVEDGANPDSTPFVIDASGNVVIGTTSTIQSVSLVPKLQLQGSNSNLASGVFVAFANDSTTSGILHIAKSRGALGTVGTIVQSGDIVGSIYFNGDDGAGLIRAAQIRAEVDGTPGTNDMPGRLLFSTTADGGSVPAERLRITSAGILQSPNGAAFSGTVTNSGNSAIIERGSSANGEYVKFADGTLICSRVNASVNSSTGFTWTYPAAFAAEPVISGNTRSGQRVVMSGFGTGSTAPTTTSVTIGAFFFNPGVAPEVFFSSTSASLMAFGRWK